MWLRNLLILGTVVCSISAPTRPPSPATKPFQCIDAIQEALSLLNGSNETAAVMNEMVEVVSEEFNLQNLTCLQQHLELYTQGLRGNLTRLKSTLTKMASYYKQHYPSTQNASCETKMITFKAFIKELREFLFIIPLGC